MQLRTSILSALLLSTGALAQNVGDTCTPDGFNDTCSGSEILFCTPSDADPTTGTVESFDCADALASCGDVGCTGSSADCVGGSLGNNCVGDAGGRCIGFGPLLDDDDTNDDAVNALRCSGDGSCRTTVDAQGAISETCVNHIGAACSTTSEAVCVGNDLVICPRDEAGTIALTANVVLDCTIFENGICGNGPNGPDCIDSTGGGEGEGEGEGEDDDDDNGGRRDDNAEPAPSGCPFNASGSFPMFGALALMLVGLRRRRA